MLTWERSLDGCKLRNHYQVGVKATVQNKNRRILNINPDLVFYRKESCALYLGRKGEHFYSYDEVKKKTG